MKLILIAISLYLVSGCAWFSKKELQTCRYRFSSLDFTGMDAGQSHWKLKLIVANPSTRKVTLTRLHFTLQYAADTLLTGWNPSQLEIAAKDSEAVEATLDVPNTTWKRLPSGIWSNTDAQFVLIADAYLNTWLGAIEVPGALRQTVHINMPKEVAKYRDMLLQKMFSWPGSKLPEDTAPQPK